MVAQQHPTPRSQLRRTMIGTSTTPWFPVPSPRAHLSIQLMETTSHQEVRFKCPRLLSHALKPETCKDFRMSVKNNQARMVNMLKFRMGRSMTMLKDVQGPAN